MQADCAFARVSNGLQMAYVEAGAREGAALLMLHGYTDSHRSFDLLRPHLPQAWRAIAMTQRGHGRSDKPDTGYAITDLAADAACLLDALGVERAIWIGHSMGAGVALQAGADFSDRVAGLVLIGGFADYDKPEIEGLAQGVAAMGDTLDPEFVLAFQESTIHHMIAQTFLDTVVGESLRCPARVWRDALEGQMQADPVAAARRCTAPALLIRGAHDAFASLADQFKLREALPSARLLSVAGAGHAPHWERPREVASQVRAFVGELEEVWGACE